MSGHRPRDRNRPRRNELMAEIRKGRQTVQERGGETLLPNILRGYMGVEGPSMREFTDRAGKQREQFIPGFELQSSLPDNLEPGRYVDINKGEIVEVTRTAPTRNRPQGMIQRKVVHRDMELKKSISDYVKKFGTGAMSGKVIAAGELALLPVALMPAAIKGAKFVATKTKNLLSDVAARDEVLPTFMRSADEPPLTGVGAEVRLKNEQLLKEAVKQNPEANYAELSKITGVDTRRIGEILGPAKKFERGDTAQLVKDQVDFNLSRDENINAIKKLKLKGRVGLIGDNIIKRSVNEAIMKEKQLAVEQYEDLFRGMYDDINYDPVADYGEKWNDPLNIIKGRETGVNKLSNYSIPNQEIAKQNLTRKIAKEEGIPEDQARAQLQEGLKSNTRKRKKSKQLKALRDGRGTPEGDAAYARYTATLAERKRRRRENKVAEAAQLPDREKQLKLNQANYAKYVNDLTVDNDNFFNAILKDKKLQKMAKTKVNPSTGQISETKVSLRRLMTKREDGGDDTRLFEIDHIKELEARVPGSEFPANRQLILQPLHRNFKTPAVQFIEKLSRQKTPLTPEQIRRVKKIIEKAKELKVSLQPNVPDGFLNQFGVTGKVINPKITGTAGVGAFREIVEEFAPSIKKMAEYNDFVTRLPGASAFGGLVESVQDEIKRIYESEMATGVRDATEEKIEDIQEKAKRNLRTERPVKFKISELANVAEEFVFKPAGTLMTAPMVGGLNTIESVYNSMRAGTEDDIDMKEKFPNVFKLFDYYTSGIGPTPDDQTYIGFIDESIRSVQKGGQNTAYNLLDLAYALPDFAFDTDLQEKLQEEYDKHAFADPETFLGNAGSILVEFGVPGSVAFKFLNMMRRGIKARTGINLAATSTYGMKGAEKAKTAISNVAKRVGIVAPSAFAGEFVGGGQYNTVTRMDPEDPLFVYDLIDTTGLTGKDLAIANFKNRVRFGTEGAVIAGLFPLLGPALYQTTKYGAIKPSAYIAGKGLQAANILAIKPVSYLLARTPGVAQAGQLGAQALGVGARFLGKDVLSRAAIGLLGTPTLKQLPDFKDWRMFEVTSSDPLQKNLKRFDNFLAYFRDTANQTADRFFITGQTSRKIKATSRKIEKQLDIIEKRAYDLARGFLKDYNTNTTSPAKQQYYLDQVLSYLKGQVDLEDLPDLLKEPASALNKTFINIKREFADVLPKEAGLKDFLNTNLRQYMRASFASFTNPFYSPDKKVFDRAVDFMVERINKNDNMVDAALRSSNLPPEQAIRNFATKQVESILERGKADGKDPLDALQFIARDNLKMDDLVVQTGEELPDVIKKLLGEENTLRTSVMTTASDLASQTANVQMYNKLAGLGLREGWLFRSAEDAIAAGIANPKRVGPRLPGLGKLNSPISETYGNKEIIESLVNTAGPLDNLLKNSLYQNLIAYKAMVQTGKTVLSPATQTRNFGSAGFFPLQSGHIGGSASVTDAFKIILDDVFGAGKIANEQELIDRITRKVELGVLDENVVVSELKDILQDVKAGNLKTLAKFSDRVDNTKLADVATRLYAGGDNVWKWYGHEYVMSQLKNGFKNVDDVVSEYKRTFGATINPKDLQEGIEQYAATLIRETYPTYSKVPKVIQTIRRIPFIGNFVSFPAEILRTTFATTGYATKHIASNNPTLRELGYRTLMGQFLTYGGIGAGTTYLGQAMTNVTSQELDDIKQYFVPEFMRFSDLIPMTDIEDGVVKVFDNSRYFPYDLITTTVGNAINRAFTKREQLDPAKIETDMFKDIYNYTGPFADLAGGTLFGVAIGYEPALDFLRGGKTKTGSAIYSESDTTLEKFDKMFAHTFETISPGFIRTLQNLYRGAAGLLTGTGQPIKMTDEVFKLFGGSSVTIDVSGSFRYQIGELKSSFREPKVSEGFFRPDFRTGDQLVREYNEQNEEAFRQQYEFFKVVRAALRNDFMSKSEVRKLLEGRVGKKTAENIIRGKYTPLSYSEDALEGRYENVKRGNPGERFKRSEYLPFNKLDRVKRDWERIDFEDYERELREPEQTDRVSQAPATEPVEQEPQTPPLPDTGAAQPGPPPVASVPNPATGLTPAESSLLSREEQLIRQRQRGLA